MSGIDQSVQALQKPAVCAVAPGIGQVQVAGPVVEEAADVVQDAPADVVAAATATAAGAGAAAVVARAGHDQVFDTVIPLVRSGT
jgi:hypothetical protein